MIPEIYERFCAINFLRQRKSVIEYVYSSVETGQMEAIIYFLDSSIEMLQNEINDIARYYGNSYHDEFGNEVVGNMYENHRIMERGLGWGVN